MAYSTPEFTPAQQAAIDSWDQGIALSAGAGSGKTTVLVYRYLRLLEQGLKPNQILALTFTKEAGTQLQERIGQTLRQRSASTELIEAVEKTSHIGTIHSFCYQILQRYGSYVDLPPLESILDPLEVPVVFANYYREWLETLPEAKLGELLQPLSHSDLRKLVRKLYQTRFEWRTLSTEDDFFQNLSTAAAPLFEKLETHFYEQGKYSFNDLEYWADQILQKQPHVLKKIATQFQKLLVDEFQDTSPIQWRILGRLVGEDYRKLFIVGDAKQSIYRFRGADVSLFLSVEKKIQQNGGERLSLSENFRTQARLLQSINAVSAPLFSDTPIEFEDMNAKRDPGDSHGFRTLRFPFKKNRTQSFPDEMRMTIQDIQEKIHSGVPPDQIALLFRASERISDFHEALQSKQIPANCTTSRPLFDHYDVTDILNYLRVCYQPLDNFALASFLRSPYIGMDYPELAVLKEDNPLFESLSKQSQTQTKTRWIVDIIERGETDIDRLLHTLFKNTSYWPENAPAFLKILEPLCGKTLSQAIPYLESWERETILMDSPNDPSLTQAVQLMTVHGAKGLEFDHVYLVDLLRRPPHPAPILRIDDEKMGFRYRNDVGELIGTETYETLAEESKKKDQEESKRLLYVALTRARETVTVLLPDSEEKLPKHSWAAYLYGDV